MRILIALALMLGATMATAESTDPKDWPVGKQVEAQQMNPGFFTCRTLDKVKEALAEPNKPVVGCALAGYPFIINVKIVEHYEHDNKVFVFAEYMAIGVATPLGVQPVTLPIAYGIWTSKEVGQAL